MARRMTASGSRQGVRSEDYWEWHPGQRVQTQDGLLGTVEAVEDGPFPQTEQYAVVYDGDMGHGWHMAGQLRSVGARESEGGLGRTVAAEDYPELAGVVEEWPSAEVPIEGKRALRDRPVEGDVVVVPEEQGYRLARVEASGSSSLGTVRGSRSRALERAAAQTDGAVWVDEADVLLRSTSSEVPVSIGRKPTSSEVATSSEVRTARRGPVEWLADSLDEYGEQFGVEYHHRPSVDWCRYRANSQCYYPRRLDDKATAQYKTPIFIAESRGYCERSKWSQQRECPMAWPETRTHDSRALPQFFDPDNPSADPLTRAASINAEGIRLAAWADVRAKATKLRQEGAINLISVTDNQVAATVRGDNGTYTTVLTLEPGTKRVAIWECECEWAKYAWGRSGRWKKLEGRMCSHALGTLYEVQSRTFGGQTIEIDEEFIRGAALVSVDFPALVNGIVQYVTSVDPDGGSCLLTDGSEVPTSSVEYHLWHPTLGLTLSASRSAKKQESVLHDEPQAALPQALGSDEDDEAVFEEPVREAAKVEMAPPKNQQEISSSDPAPFAEDVEEPVDSSGVSEVKEGSLDDLRPAWLEPGASGAQAAQAQRDADAQSLATMASAFLKEGVKAFSITEQQELISEGAVTDDGLARNLHRLDLSGTHYESDLGSDLFL